MGDAAAMSDLSKLATSVGVADLSGRSRVRVTGADSTKLLNNLCTNDLLKLPEAAWCEGFLLNAKGGVLYYARLHKTLADEFLLDLEPELGANVVKHIDRYIIREKAKLFDMTAESFSLHVCGGGAEAEVQRLLGLESPPSDRSLAAAEINNGLVVATRIDRSPFPGFDLVGPVVLKAELQERLSNAVPIETDDMERLRILAGLPVFGREIVVGCLPQEIDRNEQAISFTKGCYIGQETVARLDAMGHVNKILRGFTLDGSERPADGDKIRFNEKEVGAVSSSAVSLDGKSVKCLGIVRTAASTPGTEVLIDFEGSPRKAVVSKLPFEG